MGNEQVEKIVMDNMPDHSDGRSNVTVTVNGVTVTYNRPYSPRWGFGGWSAVRVIDNNNPIEPKQAWARCVR